MFTGMISAMIGRVYAMISSEEDGVLWLHGLLYPCEPCIDIAQCLSVTLTIATVAPQHVKLYQVHKEQPVKILFEPVQRRFHAIAIGLGMIPPGQSTSGEKILNFTEADDVLALSLEEVEECRT